MKLNRQEQRYVHKKIKDIYKNKNVQSMKKYRQHGKVTTFQHCQKVVYCSYWLKQRLHIHVDTNSLLRGAFLHDYYLYDWHEKDDSHRLHGYHHSMTALKNAKRDFNINKIECDVIENHMWPLTLFHYPKSKEAILVCIADKICTLQEIVINSHK